jgi:hypothetical protein
MRRGFRPEMSFDEALLLKMVDLTTLSRTTARHTGGYRVEEGGVCHPFGNDLMVGFIALEDNEQATFIHGDEQVAIEKGSMIAFDGRVAHNTETEGGNVRMLGPFSWSQRNGFVFVGFLCNPFPPNHDLATCP